MRKQTIIMQFNREKSKVKKIALILAIIYVAPGFIVGVSSWLDDMRTFKCIDTNAPHGYMTMGGVSLVNPDPNHCARRGLELHSIAIIPLFTIAWPVIFGGRVVNGFRGRMMNF